MLVKRKTMMINLHNLISNNQSNPKQKILKQLKIIISKSYAKTKIINEIQIKVKRKAMKINLHNLIPDKLLNLKPQKLLIINRYILLILKYKN